METEIKFKKFKKMLLPATILLIVLFCNACSKDSESSAPLMVNDVSSLEFRIGKDVVLTGAGFSEKIAENQVSINGTDAVITAANPSTLKFIVPQDASSGELLVSVKGQSLSCGYVEVEDDLLDDGVLITYIGSAGYFLETEDAKVMIDAPFDDFVQIFEVPVPSPDEQQNIGQAQEPYDDIDLFLITHEHKGHFDYQLVAQAMVNNEEALMLTTPGVVKIFQDSISFYGDFADRITAPQMLDGETQEVKLGDFNIWVSKHAHWGPVELFNFEFELEDINIAYALEKNGYSKRADIDLLFINDFMSDLNPGHIILCHQSGSANIADKAHQATHYPNASFLWEPLTQLIISEEDGEIAATAL